MRYFTLLITIAISWSVSGQVDDRISTIDFVQVLNENHSEANYYYRKNWKTLRAMAKARGYIESYEVLETGFTASEPFHLMLVTNYKNKDQYDRREEHFALVMKEKGALELLNEKKPDDFRKTLFSKNMVRHWKQDAD